MTGTLMVRSIVVALWLAVPAGLMAQVPTLPRESRLPSGARGEIRGQIVPKACFSPGDLTAVATGPGGSRRAPVRPVPGNEFRFEYVIGGLTAGTWVVTLEATRPCTGWRWAPAESRVTLATDLATAEARLFRQEEDLRFATIRADEVTLLVRTALTGTQIRLHNWDGGRGRVTESDRTTWLAEGQSYLKTSRVMGGDSLVILFPELRYDPPGLATFYYYINDFRLNPSSFRAGYERRRFQLSLSFEDAGVELRGYCAARGDGLVRTKPTPGCPSGPDDTAPDLDLFNNRLTITFAPGVTRDSLLTYDDVAVDFAGEVEIGGVLFESLQPALRRDVRAGVNTAVRAILMDPKLRADFARAIRPELARRGIGKVVRVEARNDVLLVFHVPER